ncbi:putative AbiEi antitoxin of type IV toxin-antitoxin system [Jatrophihabitans sp. GAS493]|uniref:type IV toxin-antitoxin system AbiEi family antitoxin domain-containing protein n=1 Tax=Jatrophihabitans sp. GAS493 TaxID=1907575 RepID=UPI000BC073AA|nr:type IV toxin-antitoxin system AbiEi family antitoxin domain-containing protein [Jatrophihabitans sp. GAS493]SOD70461.1 putative AbiEi antitoxin of type IV toxin-antitoxin system [Jatrophihabitans sp. GAS493]
MRRTPPGNLFSRGEALEIGWTDSALARAVATGKLRRLRQGYYTRADVPPESVPTLAALAASAASGTSGTPGTPGASGASAGRPRAVLSHFTATEMHGLPILRHTRSRQIAAALPRLTVRPGMTGHLQGVHLHRASLREQDVVRLGAASLTSVARTVIDVARTSALIDGIVCADAALNQAKTTEAELDDVLNSCAGWPGSAAARRVLHFADWRAESALESISRWTMHDLGIPAPILQPRIRTDRGTFVARVDFYWDEFGVVGEADGELKYGGGGGVLLREKRRQERLEELGLVVVRWGWEQAAERPATLHRRLRRAFTHGMARRRIALLPESSVQEC